MDDDGIPVPGRSVFRWMIMLCYFEVISATAITAKQQGKPQAKTTAAGTVAAGQQRLGVPTTPAGAAPSR